MDLDSVQKKTVSTVSDRYLFPVPGFQDCIMTFVIFDEIPFSLCFFLIHDKLSIQNWECLLDLRACMKNTSKYEILVAKMVLLQEFSNF